MRTCLVVLLVAAGCFSDANTIEPGDESDTGTTSEGSTGPELTSAASSSGAMVDTSTGAVDSDGSGTGGCPDGSAGCPCLPGRLPTCDEGLQCQAEMCVPTPGACVVRYGGAAGSVEFAVSRVSPDGAVVSAANATIGGAHEVTEAVAGPDMLTACGPSIYAVLADEAAVLVLALEPPEILEVQRLVLPEPGVGARSLRALECVNGGEQLVAVTVASGRAAGAQIELWSLPRGGDGMLEAPVQMPTAVGVVAGDSDEIGLAWAPTAEHGYVMFEDTIGNNASVLDFSIDEAGAIVTTAPAAPTVGLSRGVGALEVTPDESFLALVGTILGGNQMGAGVRFPINGDSSVNLGYQSPNGPYDQPLWRAASSLSFVGLPTAGPLALSVGDGQLLVSDFTAGNGPEERLIFDLEGDGPGAAFAVHGGQVLVAATRESVSAFDGSGPVATLEQPLSPSQLDEIVNLSAAIVVPCPPAPPM